MAESKWELFDHVIGEQTPKGLPYRTPIPPGKRDEFWYGPIAAR
jgi:hypothetical protein